MNTRTSWFVVRACHSLHGDELRPHHRIHAFLALPLGAAPLAFPFAAAGLALALPFATLTPSFRSSCMPRFASVARRLGSCLRSSSALSSSSSSSANSSSSSSSAPSAACVKPCQWRSRLTSEHRTFALRFFLASGSRMPERMARVSLLHSRVNALFTTVGMRLAGSRNPGGTPSACRFC